MVTTVTDPVQRRIDRLTRGLVTRTWHGMMQRLRQLPFEDVQFLAYHAGTYPGDIKGTARALWHRRRK